MQRQEPGDGRVDDLQVLGRHGSFTRLAGVRISQELGDAVSHDLRLVRDEGCTVAGPVLQALLQRPCVGLAEVDGPAQDRVLLQVHLLRDHRGIENVRAKKIDRLVVGTVGVDFRGIVWGHQEPIGIH